MKFHPKEALFSPTAKCNLGCPHCAGAGSGETLPKEAAERFLFGCKRLGVERIGFTGGEPFLAPDFLRAVVKTAVKEGLLFGRIMTNGVWYTDACGLRSSLGRLRKAGYDGEICVSIDAFHGQDLRKAARFIKTVLSIWKRPDVVTVASVTGARDEATEGRLKLLSGLLGARLGGLKGRHPHIKGKGLFIRIFRIGLSPVGRAEGLKDGWDGRWFKEDHCKGPGNIFFVEADGDVRPCCGYAEGSARLVVGNIKHDSPGDIIENARGNSFVSAVFGPGLSRIRKALERMGVKFPGKTSSHCYFCDYILTKVPAKTLDRCMDSLKAFFFAALLVAGLSSFSSAEDRTLEVAKDCRSIKARVVKKVPLPQSYHEGLFYDGGSIWVVNGEGGKVWVVDPSSGAVRSEMTPVAGFAEAITRRSDGALFMSDWTEKRLYRLRIDGDNKMTPESSVSFAPAHPAGILWNGDRFFVITWTRGIFGTKFDIIDMDGELNIKNRIAVKSIQEPAHLAWDGRYLWVTSWYSRTVYKIDVSRWEIVGIFRSPVSKTTGIVWDGRYLWVTGTRSDLHQVEISGN